MKPRYPLRMMICLELRALEAASARELYALLKPDYEHEAFVDPACIAGHLQAMKAVGIVDVHRAELDENKELTQYFRLTAYGREHLAHAL